MALVALVMTVGSAVAQDAGEPDSIVIEFGFIPPNADSINAGHDSVLVQLWGKNDYTVTAISSGWKWLTPEMVMTNGTLSDEFIAGFESGTFKYYKNRLDSSNVYRRFQCAGLTYDALGGLQPGRTLLGTWRFQLTGVPDSVGIDTTKSPGLNFVVDFSNEFAPSTNRQLVYKYNGTSVNPIGNGVLPNQFALAQNYPNPFNPSTKINFDIPERNHVSLAVFNVLGQKVATLVDEDLPAGSYEREWLGIGDSGAKVASGIYFYRLSAGEKVMTKKMMMLK